MQEPGEIHIHQFLAQVHREGMKLGGLHENHSSVQVDNHLWELGEIHIHPFHPQTHMGQENMKVLGSNLALGPACRRVWV